MATYSPSKITKDGNTYNFTDTTKIPLAGTNALSGSIVPNTDNSVDLGASSKNIKMIYTKGITINGTQFLPSDYIPRSGGAVLTGWLFARTVNDSHATYCGGTNSDNGAFVRVHGKDYSDSTYAGTVLIRAKNNSDYFDLFLKPDGTLAWGSKNVAMREDVIPRSGGAVISGNGFYRTADNDYLTFSGGTGWQSGGGIALYGPNITSVPGTVQLLASLNSDNNRIMMLYPDGTWTWNGTACQITSDQRYKQQIAEIDDKLLDAWEDVELSQFKYNDAVDQKKDKARLHTGYVVQQIDDACKSHGVDISEYGLYCHEECEEETREVEHEDGTKTIEVVRPASEHYSLRYTEALIVECAYLRKCIKELRNEIEELKSSK